MLIRQLYPAPAEVDSREVYAVPGGVRHLRVNMVASVDGAATVQGRVGALTGPADQQLLHELRTQCDVLLVGAGTVRAEGYGPLVLTAPEQGVREARGQAPVPRLAVVSRSLDLDLAAPVFARATAPPLVVTTRTAPADRRKAASDVADVVVAGADDVDLAAALEALAGAGLPQVLSEGGPGMLGQLFRADLVDELCLAVSPIAVGGPDGRITAGAPPDMPRRLGLSTVAERDGFLFLRYVRYRTTGTTVGE